MARLAEFDARATLGSFVGCPLNLSRLDLANTVSCGCSCEKN